VHTTLTYSLYGTHMHVYMFLPYVWMHNQLYIIWRIIMLPTLIHYFITNKGNILLMLFYIFFLENL
jgi:hypothetical protein